MNPLLSIIIATHNGDKYIPKAIESVLAQNFCDWELIIEHLENPWKLFRDVKSVLRKDGIFILSTPNIMSSYSRWMFLFSGYFKWFTPKCFSYHINPLPIWEIRIINKKIGFKELKVLGSGDFFFKRSNRNIKKVISNNEGIIFVFQKI